MCGGAFSILNQEIAHTGSRGDWAGPPVHVGFGWHIYAHTLPSSRILCVARRRRRRQAGARHQALPAGYRVRRPLLMSVARKLRRTCSTRSRWAALAATPILEELSRESGESGHLPYAWAMPSSSSPAPAAPAHSSSPTARVGRARARPLHGARQDRRLAAPGPAQAFPGARRAEAVDRKIDHRPQCADARVGRRGAPRQRSRHRRRRVQCRSAASRCLCSTSPCGDVIGALGVSGPVWRMTDEVLKGRAKQVRAAAARLSAEVRRQGDVVPSNIGYSSFAVMHLALTATAASGKYSNNKRTSTSSQTNIEQDGTTSPGGRTAMVSTNRRTLLKGGAAFAALDSAAGLSGDRPGASCENQDRPIRCRSPGFSALSAAAMPSSALSSRPKKRSTRPAATSWASRST